MPLSVEALEDEQTAAHRLTVARQTRPDPHDEGTQSANAVKRWKKIGSPPVAKTLHCRTLLL